MSQEERDMSEWLKRAKDGVITQREAARKMGVICVGFAAGNAGKSSDVDSADSATAARD